MDVAPTIITGENFFEDSTSKFLVYTGNSIDAGQGIYFYSLQTRQTFAKISDAEIFLDLYKDTNSGMTKVVFFKNEEVTEQGIDLSEAL